MTPDEHRRAVEVMARAIADDDRCVAFINCAYHGGCACMSGSEAALTALLKIADVKMKERENG